jgi:PAS domain S-box-containing protein
MVDSTDRKEAQTRYEHAVKQWQRTFDAVRDPLFILDTEGMIQMANQAASEMLGLPLTQIVGSPCYKVVHGTGSFIPECPFVAMKGSGKREEYLLEQQGRWFQVVANPLRDEMGQITGAVHSITDITALREAELTQSFLASIVRSSDDAIIGMSPEGIIRSWNSSAERILGHPAAEVMGKPISEVVPEDKREDVEHIFSRVRSGELGQHHDAYRLYRDGKPIEIIFSVSTIKSESGEIIGFSTIGRDITARREAERALLAFITEAALRVRHPVEIVHDRLQEMVGLAARGEITMEEIRLLLQVQIRHSEQILANLNELHEAILGGKTEIPENYRKFLLR